jgi:hypothetical protein
MTHDVHGFDLFLICSSKNYMRVFSIRKSRNGNNIKIRIEAGIAFIIYASEIRANLARLNWIPYGLQVYT